MDRDRAAPAAALRPADRRQRQAAAALLLCLACLCLVVAPGMLLAADGPAADKPSSDRAGPEKPATEAPQRETVLSLTLKGGWLMIPIGMCSVVVLTWTIERIVSLRRSRVLSPTILEEVFRVLPPRGRATREQVAAALRLLDADGTIIARVIRVGVEKIHRDEAHVQAFLEETAAKEIHVLKRSLRPFEISASIAPLLGLLGTIFGMISCFERTTLADTAARAETLANGIYVALVTTAAGLCVAIPALLIEHFFVGRVDRIQDAVEEAATEFLDHYYSSPAAVRARPAAPAQGPGHGLGLATGLGNAPTAAGVVEALRTDSLPAGEAPATPGAPASSPSSSSPPSPASSPAPAPHAALPQAAGSGAMVEAGT